MAVPIKILQNKILEELHLLLQEAIKIEHSTMPAYCYALWSIKDPNSELAKILRSVVREEMLHMSLVCNILNALDGHPKINNKEKIPLYPTGLPGHSKSVHPLTIHLDKLSLENIVTCIHIELPQSRDLSWKEILSNTWTTIGEFYMDIERHIEWLGSDSYFRYGRQCKSNSIPKNAGVMVEVKSVKSALLAITEIIKQGEGLETESHLKGEFESHFDTFVDVYEDMGGTGKVNINDFEESDLLDSYDEGKYKAFQENILNVVRDPIQNNSGTDNFKKANLDFNSAYSRMLDDMQFTFNSPSPDITNASKNMFAMERLARTVMSIPIDANDLSKGYCGPTFQYIEAKKRTSGY